MFLFLLKHSVPSPALDKGLLRRVLPGWQEHGHGLLRQEHLPVAGALARAPRLIDTVVTIARDHHLQAYKFV